MAKTKKGIYGHDSRWRREGNPLSEGGQAHVYFVSDSSGVLLGEYVIKVLKNIKRSDRLDREISTTRSLFDSGCAVLEIVDDYLRSEPGAVRPWYVAPYIPDGALSKRLIPNSPYGGSIRTALELYRKIVVAVLGVHDKGISHRDLKPDNIFLNGEIVILGDLGLALVVGESEGERLTDELERIGSLHYMPPEAFSRRPLDQNQLAFDAFALGKILYEVLAGKPLPAFESPLDPTYDLTRVENSLPLRAVNRILRGLLHEKPPTRLLFLDDLLEQVDDLINEPIIKVPLIQKAELLNAGNLLAAKALTISKQGAGTEDRELLDQMSKEAVDFWESSGVIDELIKNLGVEHGGHLRINRPTGNQNLTSTLKGTTRTHKGMEPLEDRGFPRWPDATSGSEIGVMPGDGISMRFRPLRLFGIVALKNEHLHGAVGVVRTEVTSGRSTDIVEGRISLITGKRTDTTFASRFRTAASDMMMLFVEDIIAESKIVANQQN